MRIVTTPMCKEVLKLAGISDFIVREDPNSVDADIAVVLSETKTNIKSIKIKLNTFSQIKESIRMLSEIFGTEPLESLNYNTEKEEIENLRNFNENQKIKVKVYSNFLRDIVKDMGFKVVDQDYDFVVYPDYMEDEIKDVIKNKKVIKVPSHKNVPEDPLERAKLRYRILERKLCMKP